MKSIFKTSMVVSVAALGLSLAACDSATENQAEDEIEATEEVAEEQIDLMEETGEVTDEQADMMEENVEAEADAAEEAVDETDPAM